MTSTPAWVGNPRQANSAAKLGIVGLRNRFALDMAKYHVRSNCISPFAWSRMIGRFRPRATTRRSGREAEVARDGEDRAAGDVSGSDSARTSRGDLPRSAPTRSSSFTEPAAASWHRAEGWTAETVGAHAIPALRAHFYPLDRSQDIFSWDPPVNDHRVLIVDPIAAEGETLLARAADWCLPGQQPETIRTLRGKPTAVITRSNCRTTSSALRRGCARGDPRHRHRPGAARRCDRRACRSRTFPRHAHRSPSTA